jgi:O-succinylbenzoate synthase
VTRGRIAVNATVPAVPAGEVPSVLARFPGCRTAKVKVAERGQTLADDVARVRAVREAMGPDATVRVDANGGWSVDEAVAALTALAEFDLDYAEQPCAGVDELVRVRAHLTGGQGVAGVPSIDVSRDDGVAGSHATVTAEPATFGLEGGPSHRVRIAADESVRKAEDPLAVARAGAADLLVIKAAPLGGIDRALAIVAEAGLPAVVSSALDTSIGLAIGAELAARLPQLEHDCGLGTAALLADDVVADPLRPVDGAIAVRPVVADPDALRRLAADPARAAWWRERLTRCHALLSA